jgi:hypothetical protein
MIGHSHCQQPDIPEAGNPAIAVIGAHFLWLFDTRNGFPQIQQRLAIEAEVVAKPRQESDTQSEYHCDTGWLDTMPKLNVVTPRLKRVS